MSEEHVRPDLDMLADYLEDLLSDEERAEVERAVAEDPSTAALLAELEGLPALLSADPPEPMPADVVARIDAALADEAAAAKKTESSKHLAPVRSMPSRRRRWLAPALAAAAAVGVVGLGAQVVTSGMGSGAGQDAESAMDAGAGADEAVDNDVEAPRESERMLGPEDDATQWRTGDFVELSAERFSEDVASALADRPRTFARDRVASFLLRDGIALEESRGLIVEAECGFDLPSGRVIPARLDGEAAVLVLRRVPGEPDQRDVLAFPAECPAPAGDTTSDVPPLASTRLPYP
jgi:negative regulator of sigma E activity